MFEIDHKPIETGAELITITGRVMLGPESEQIEALVSELLDAGCRRIIFDFSGITHIDSTGIGRFIAALNLSMRVDAELRIAGAAGQVRESFRVTLLDTVFRFYDNVPAALAG